MIIEEKDFRLESTTDSSLFFDLELLRIINKGKDNEREEFKNEAYGLTIDSAIKRIANYRISNKHQKDALDIKTYFEEFKQEIEKLLQVCDFTKQNFSID